MHSLRRYSVINDWFVRRSGVIAIREMLLIFVVPMGLLWMVSRAMTIVENHSKAAVKIAIRPVYNISVEHDEHHMWVYRLREDVVRINLLSGAVEQSLLTPGTQLSAVAHSHDHSSVLLCGADGTVFLFRDGEVAKAGNLSPDAGFDAAVSDDGAVAITATPSGQFWGWRRQGSDMQDFGFKLTSSSVVLRIGLNPTGRRLFFAQSDGIVSFRKLEMPDRDDMTLNVGAECVAFAWSRDERRFGVVTRDSQVRIYNVETGVLLYRTLLDQRSANFNEGCIASISPDAQRMVVSSTGSTEIYLWDLEAGVPVRRLKGHLGLVHSMQFSPNSERLYSGSYDGTIREWSLKTCSQLRVIN